MKIKIHSSYRDVVSICDSDLIGQRFEEEFENGVKQIDVRANFYEGEEIYEEELFVRLVDLAREDATFNIVGSESVRVALKARIISKEGVKTVQGIPFAFVLM